MFKSYKLLKNIKNLQPSPIYSLYNKHQKEWCGFLCYTGLIFHYKYLLHIFFLLFAFIIWPSWIPWSLYKAEKNKTAKNYLQLLSYYGLAYSIAGIVYLAYSGVHADVAQCHVAYSFNTSSWLALTSLLLYIVPVIGSFFISTMNYSIFAGTMLALSCAISYWLWLNWFISIWCFFCSTFKCRYLFFNEGK